MQNKENSIYISFLNKEHERISLWKDIKAAYRLVRLIYRRVRFKTHYPNQDVESNLKHLKKIFTTLKISPINPYHYWVDSQLTPDTNGMIFNTKWY